MSPSLRSLGSISLFALALAACGPETTALRAPDAPPSPPAPRPAATDDPGPASLTAKPAETPARPPPSLMVEQIQGADAARTRAVFAPLQSSLKECTGTNGGGFIVQFERKRDATKMHIDPSAALDARQRRCALEILSTVDTDGVLERGSPADRPSGFTAQIRVQW